MHINHSPTNLALVSCRRVGARVSFSYLHALLFNLSILNLRTKKFSRKIFNFLFCRYPINFVISMRIIKVDLSVSY